MIKQILHVAIEYSKLFAREKNYSDEALPSGIIFLYLYNITMRAAPDGMTSPSNLQDA
jgi:hypothetical protein